MTGTTVSTSFLKPQLSAVDVFYVLGFKQPQKGSQRDYYMAVRQLAEQVVTSFQPTSEQLRQLRALDPSPKALTRKVDPEIREIWTTAMLLLDIAPHYGDGQTIENISNTVIAQGRHICQQFGVSLQAAVTGLREASQLVGSSR